MMPLFRRLLLTLFVAAPWVLIASGASAADNQAELQRLQKEIAKLQTWLEETQTEHSEISAKLQESDKDISGIVKKIEATRAKLEKERDRLKKLHQEQGQLRHLKAEQKHQLAQQLIGAQKLGNQGSIKVLLNQDDPQQLNRMLKYYEYFNQSRIEHIQGLIENLKRLDNIEEEIKQAQAKLEASENTLLAERKQLGQRKQKHKQLLASLNSQINRQQSDIKQKEKDQKRLQSLIKEVATLLDNSVRKHDARPIRALKGKLPRPVSGRVVKAFGNRNSETRSRWQGWLMKAYEGAPIKAVHHGRVVFSDWFRGFGLLIIIDHGNGYLSLYARNQSLLRSVGDWINQGDTIATLGSSGGFKEPRLYFEIRHKGSPKDPAAWLSRK